MKKSLFLLSVILLTLSVSLNAQGFNKNTKNLSFGIGVGGFAGMYGSSTLPPVSVGYQMAVTEKISVGGIVGYAGSSEEFFGGKWKYSYVLIGGRGEYHFLERNDKWDAYAGLTLGYNVVSSSWDGSGISVGTAEASGLLYGFHVGAKYSLSPKWGVYGEVGYGIGVLNLGAYIKL